MKYIITGSLGNISLPVTKNLVAAGHEVVVISSNTSKKADIENFGATAAIGSLSDLPFVKSVFNDADVVYLMIPSDFTVVDFPKLQREIADNYIQALEGSAVKNVVVLSSIGAHLRKDSGPIDGLGYLEEKLLGVSGINTVFLRPSYFFNNLYSQSGLIRNAGIAGSNFGNTDEKLVLVQTDHIAAEATRQLLDTDFTGNRIVYIANDERHPNEIAEVLSASIDKPGTPWVTFTDEQAFEGMLGAGLNEGFANLYVAMGKAIREGRLQEHYWQNKPAELGTFKLEDFAKDFAKA
ncbi:NAD(P)H-binding protein [Dyadobacter sp. CY312]|uniref:NAD(P)H-binding protein n=1 Tax=Dyadobacter sp. CY312 TaxID=2907303 RepID=UPI001F1F9543|nr:NAD(P)H-binding protein [Dyadobacter sp. CY312]MCE7040937.1 NAD(P)H-binding protein [Dyadobacter sp. CY312]